MTTQCGDILIDDENNYKVRPYPLDTYRTGWDKLTLGGKCVSRFRRFSTACHRGYVARWLIDDERLYLVGIRAYDSERGELTIEDVFGTSKLAATWYDGPLTSNVGERIYGMYNPTFEKNCVWEFEGGVLQRRYVRTNNTPEDLEQTARHWKMRNFTDTL